MRRRHGFTFIELQITISVAGMFAALMAPGITSVREAARRTQCRDNIHNLGIGLHNYHEAHNTLPPGWIAGTYKADNQPHFGWQSRILPYIEQGRLYRRLNHKQPTFKGLTQIIRVFRCPSDTMSARNPMRGGFGTSNYSGNFGSVAPPRFIEGSVAKSWVGKPDTPRAANGVFFCNSNVTLDAITNKDGTSATFMVGEKCVVSSGGIWPGVRGNEYESDAVTACPIGDAPNKSRSSFSSRHEGFVFMGYCDGSVRPVKDNIQSGPKGRAGIWQFLSSRDDGRAIQPPN